MASFVDLSVFALNLVTGLGLGLAIDYSLFMVSRYREEAAVSGYGATALRRTLQTAGRTILFSSLTVAAAIASLTIFPQRFLSSMGIAGALVALLAAALALVVLPAVLAVLGPRGNALAPKRLARAAEHDARPAESGAWYRLSRFVMRRPAQIAIASATFLIVLGIPFWGVRFISVDASVLPTTTSARQVDDALKQQFPPNRTAPLDVVVGAPAGSQQVKALAARIERLPNVSAVSPAQPAGRFDSLLLVAPRRGPLTHASQQLVHDVRAIHEPFYVGVAGDTAAQVDLEHSLAAHLPLVLAIVIGDALILFLMTGSVVLPIKAVLMNALTLTAVFRNPGADLPGREPGGPVGLPQRGSARRHAADPAVAVLWPLRPTTASAAFTDQEAYDGGASAPTPSRSASSAPGAWSPQPPSCSRSRSAARSRSRNRVHQGARSRRRTGGADRRVDRPRAAVPSLMALLGSLNWWAPAPCGGCDRIGLRGGRRGDCLDAAAVRGMTMRFGRPSEAQGNNPPDWCMCHPWVGGCSRLIRERRGLAADSGDLDPVVARERT